MAFRREILPRETDTESLTQELAGIGMNFSAKKLKSVNIEDALLHASVEGMVNDDLRVLAILTTWMFIHSAGVNVDRLTQIVAIQESSRVRAYWASIALGLSKDRRFDKMKKIYKGKRLDLLRVGNEFQIERKGEDERFLGTYVRVPAGTLRDRERDVLSPSQLCSLHDAYRWRTIIGPTFRADMWAELEQNPDTNPAQLARRTYGSFSTAWSVKKDWSRVHASV